MKKPVVCKSSDPRQIYARCVHNAGRIDLIVGKRYRIKPDPEASAENYIRVVDDSGEDYLYPRKWFQVIRNGEP